MTNGLQTKHSRNAVAATVSGAKPGDFPVGSVQSRAAARALLANHAAEQAQEESAEFANLTPYEIAIAEGEEPEVARQLVALARFVEERAKIFGFSLETPEEIRHVKRVAKLANKIAEGQYLEIMLCDPCEGKRIRDLAEEQLKAESPRQQEQGLADTQHELLGQ